MRGSPVQMVASLSDVKGRVAALEKHAPQQHVQLGAVGSKSKGKGKAKKEQKEKDAKNDEDATDEEISRARATPDEMKDDRMFFVLKNDQCRPGHKVCTHCFA